MNFDAFSESNQVGRAIQMAYYRTLYTHMQVEVHIFDMLIRSYLVGNNLDLSHLNISFCTVLENFKSAQVQWTYLSNAEQGLYFVCNYLVSIIELRGPNLKTCTL